jgi:1-acyl-sn-glycerol-3-phosphate acyltransferase
MLLRTSVLVVFFFLAVIGFIPIFLICALAGWREPLLSYSRGVLRAGRAVLGIRLRIEGQERLDVQTAYVFMANHASFLDGPLLFISIPQRLRIILKKSLLRIPVVGPGMKYVGFVPVDRRAGRSGQAAIERASAMMRAKKVSFLIFPEGTRSRDGHLQAFRRGGFFLALNAGASIVPVSIRGAFRLMPRGRWIPRRGDVEIIFHPPLAADDVLPEDMETLTERAWAAVASGLEGECHD